jgi:hypothetical protein
MEPKYITFEQAKFFSSKELDIDCTSFYVKPNCKLFSVDEHGRHYSIKNTPKKLYKLGEHFVLKDENVFLAPEQHQVVDWLLGKHGIWIYSDFLGSWKYVIVKLQDNSRRTVEHFNSPQEAYSAAFDYIKNNNLI